MPDPFLLVIVGPTASGKTALSLALAEKFQGEIVNCDSVAMVREFEALGIDLVVLDQAIDSTTPAGRLLFHVLAAISEFERDLIRDRVIAGMRRAR